MPRIDQQITYDDQDRLAGVSGPDGEVVYTYDPAGNRTEVVAPASPEGVVAAEEPVPAASPAGEAPVGLACGRCGEGVSRADNFCRSCGAKLQ